MKNDRYIAPAIEVFEISVEAGFAVSSSWGEDYTAGDSWVTPGKDDEIYL